MRLIKPFAGILAALAISPVVAPLAMTPTMVQASESLTLSTKTHSMFEGENFKITANLKNVIWTTGNSNATVKDGLVTAKKAGKVTIYARSGNEVAQTVIEIKKKIAVTGVKITGNAQLIQNGTLQLKADVAPTNATNRKATWSSSDNQIATVNQSGKVTGVRAGKVKIKVTTEDGKKTAEKQIQVMPANYTGFINTTYYESGKVTGKKTGVVSGTINGITGKWNVKDSKLKTGVDVRNDATTWYYVNKNGQVDTSFTGIASNENGKWWIDKGIVTFKTTADKTYNGKNYYIRGSKVIGELADVKTGWYKIQVTKNKKFTLDIANNKSTNGTSLVIYQNHGDVNQKFKIEKVSDKTNTYYKVLTGSSGAKSTIDAGTDTAYQWEWIKKDNQKWKIIKNGAGISFINVSTGKALDVSGANFANSTKIITHPINTTDAQRFSLVSTPEGGEAVNLANGWYRIQPVVNSGYSLDVSGDKHENYTNIQVWQNNNANAQRFYLQKVGDKYLIRTGSSFGLSAIDAGGKNLNVHEWIADTTNANQLWTILKTPTGYSLYNPKTDKYLDLVNGDVKSNVRTWEDNGAKAERWNITKTDAPSGYKANGWSGNRYFINGIPATKWKKIDNAWYNFGMYGIKKTGMQWMTSDDGEKTPHFSYFGNNGKLVTGWFKYTDGFEKLRYADSNGWIYAKGHKANTWQKIGRVYYRFNDNGHLTGANMPDYNKNFNQRAFGYWNGCGPTALLAAASATGQLKKYDQNATTYKNYMYKWYGNKKSYTMTLTYLRDNSFDVNVYDLSNTHYSTDKIKQKLTHGQTVIPIVSMYTKQDSSPHWVLHFVAVTGWRMEKGKLEFYTNDSYGGNNTGWHDVNKNGGTSSASGYNVYTTSARYNGSTEINPAGVSSGRCLTVGNQINL